MSLKDEIEKIIQAERDKLRAKNLYQDEYNARQTARFQPLAAVFSELLDSIDSRFARGKVHMSHAIIEVGDTNAKGDFSRELTWEIQPNYSIDGAMVFHEQPGFRVNETHYPDIYENRRVVPTEKAAVEAIAEKIGEKIARRIS